jgi:hypothetical protein
MKNIHILPTDKPSKMWFNLKGKLVLDTVNCLYEDIQCQNIYITNSEEIKEGDWCLDENENIVKADKDFIFNCSHEFDEYWKKIILTTDQDLIKDGVQAIDDEFLEWFVNNPSCEFVKTDSYKTIYNTLLYKIIIPSKETLKKLKSFYEKYPKEEPKQETEHLLSTETNKKRLLEDVNKQETLEEAALKVYPDYSCNSFDTLASHNRRVWIKGAKWQAEQDKNKYSEEEVYTIQEISDLFIPIGKNGYIDNYLDYRLFSKDQPKLNFKEWFEKLKKQ